VYRYGPVTKSKLFYIMLQYLSLTSPLVFVIPPATMPFGWASGYEEPTYFAFPIKFVFSDEEPKTKIQSQLTAYAI